MLGISSSAFRLDYFPAVVAAEVGVVGVGSFADGLADVGVHYLVLHYDCPHLAGDGCKEDLPGLPWLGLAASMGDAVS